MPLLEEELLPWLEAAEAGTLGEMPARGPRLKKQTAVHVVMAASGYPGTVKKGDSISIEEDLLRANPDYKVLFAGVSGEASHFATNGGRVLGLTALSDDRTSARRLAYELIQGIHFNGAQRRSDVGEV